MGSISKGILGGFSGKVGTVVGANRSGKDIMRSLPKKSDRLPTDEPLALRQKFALVTKLTTIVSPFSSNSPAYKIPEVLHQPNQPSRSRLRY